MDNLTDTLSFLDHLFLSQPPPYRIPLCYRYLYMHKMNDRVKLFALNRMTHDKHSNREIVMQILLTFKKLYRFVYGCNNPTCMLFWTSARILKILTVFSIRKVLADAHSNWYFFWSYLDISTEMKIMLKSDMESIEIILLKRKVYSVTSRTVIVVLHIE